MPCRCASRGGSCGRRRARFLFVVLAVAVGVGSLTGVRGFSRAFRAHAAAQARTLMAADMTRAHLRPARRRAQESARSTAWKRAACAAPGSPRPSPWRLRRRLARPAAGLHQSRGPARSTPFTARSSWTRRGRCAQALDDADRGRLGRPAAAAGAARRRCHPPGRAGVPHRRRGGRRAGPHDRQPQRRPAGDDHAARAWTAPG